MKALRGAIEQFIDLDGKAGELEQDFHLAGSELPMHHGDVVIAAITSCTNTSNPAVMIGAGLVARKAREKGLTRKPWVKTSLAPGSKVVTDYLVEAGLLEDLEAVFVGNDPVGVPVYNQERLVTLGRPFRHRRRSRRSGHPRPRVRTRCAAESRGEDLQIPLASCLTR